MTSRIVATRAASLLAVAALLGGCTEWSTSEVSTSFEPVINGDLDDPEAVNQARLSVTVNNCPLGLGSAVFLDNQWLLTAAHNVDGDNRLSGGGTCSNGQPKANAVLVRLGNQQQVASTIVIHPRYRRQGHVDMALLHVNEPFVLNGSATGYSREISDLDTSALGGRNTRCFGYGPTERGGGADGTLHSAEFVVVPTIAEAGGSFTVFKGGGSSPTDSGSDVMLAPGDSGGGCINPDDAIAGAEEVFGINRNVDPRSCIDDSDCAEGTTCNTETFRCTPENDALSAQVQAGQSFRNFARAALTAAAPPVHVDWGRSCTADTQCPSVANLPGVCIRPACQLQGCPGFCNEFSADGIPDATIFLRSLGGFFVIEIQDADGNIFDVPTGLFDDGSVGAAVQNFGAVSFGDFNGDGVSDLLALVGGFPFYFDSSNLFDPANPFSDQGLEISGTEGFAYVAVRDVNRDGRDDAEFVRLDGSSEMFLGSDDGLGASRAPPPIGPDFDGDGREDIAITAIGSLVADTDDPEPGDTPGAVHVLYGDGMVQTLYGDVVAGPDSVVRDAFGSNMYWGNFDADAADELLIDSDPGAHWRYMDFQTGSLFFSTELLGDGLNGFIVGVGDFDGDGVDDMALSVDDPDTRERPDFMDVVFGDREGPFAPGHRRVRMGLAELGLSGGFARGKSGDFDCDGKEDLVLTVGFGGSIGDAVVLYSDGDGFSRPQPWGPDNTEPGTTPRHHFGRSFVTGNFNGDHRDGIGCVDLAISDSEATAPGSEVEEAGMVHVLYGGPDGLTNQGAQLLAPCCFDAVAFPIGGSGFGKSMTISDMDADGFDDLLIGLSNAIYDETGRGLAFVYLGSAAGIDESSRVIWSKTPPAYGGLGESVGGTSNGLMAVGMPFFGGFDGELFPGGFLLIDPLAEIEVGSAFIRPEYFPGEPFKTLGWFATGARPGRFARPSRERVDLPGLGISGTFQGFPQRLDFASFDDPRRPWTSRSAIARNFQLRTHGPASLEVPGGHARIESPAFATNEWLSVGSELLLDVFMPTGGNEHGAIDLRLSAPAPGVHFSIIDRVPIDDLETGQWNTVTFRVTERVRAALLGDFEGVRFVIDVGRRRPRDPILLDNLRFAGELEARPRVTH